jgi:RNA polymerase sigma-70 factor (ECF subfamily)
MENYSEAEVESETDWPELSVEKIEQAMMHLPEGYKIVFRLFMFENLSHQEISDMLGISESTSKTQLFKARRKLRNVLIAN